MSEFLPLTPTHVAALAKAFAGLLRNPAPGTLAFTEALPRAVIDALIDDPGFTLDGWDIAAVTERSDPANRRMTSDQAMERREDKADQPTLLLVDQGTAGAGMNGVTNASREIGERELMDAARDAALCRLDNDWRRFADAGRATARKSSRLGEVTPWAEFHYAATAADPERGFAPAAAAVGLWPRAVDRDAPPPEPRFWDESAAVKHRLIGEEATGSVQARVASLRLRGDGAAATVEAFLRTAVSRPPHEVLRDAAAEPRLWFDALQPDLTPSDLKAISLEPWVSVKTKKIGKWTGLTPRENALPELRFDLDAEGRNAGGHLEVRWKSDPPDLPNNAAEYLLRVMSGEEVLAYKQVPHATRAQQKFRFTRDAFDDLDEDAKFEARVVLDVVGDNGIPSQESEDFFLCFGEIDKTGSEAQGGGARPARCAMIGAIELDGADFHEQQASWHAEPRDAEDERHRSEDKKGNVTFRATPGRRGVMLQRPAMLRAIEERWALFPERLGHWAVRVREDGEPVAAPEFQEWSPTGDVAAADRASKASARFLGPAMRRAGGLTAEIFDDSHPTVAEYLLAWEKLLEEAADQGDPGPAACNTLEVHLQDGRPVGVIALPSHPSRVAWQVAFDRLLQHSRQELGMKAHALVRELEGVDGAQHPPCLPRAGKGGKQSGMHLFVDTLGSHAAVLVADDEPEPKAAVAQLTRCYGGIPSRSGPSGDLVPTVGEHAGTLLGRELSKFVRFHALRRSLHVHAIRAGDGRTMARALGLVQREAEAGGDGAAGSGATEGMAFELQLFPGERGRRSGGFLSDVLERRRSGASGVAASDAWMLESVGRPGGVTLPRLRWSRREERMPHTEAAHVAAAFDTFRSVPEVESLSSLLKDADPRPGALHGLISRPERRAILGNGEAHWTTMMPPAVEPTAHPAGGPVGKRLQAIQHAVLRAVGNALRDRAAEADRPAVGDAWPTLLTEITHARLDELKTLHELCDWVITIDRNVGIELFDAPRDNAGVYEAYVIDCVPERDDLSNTQMVTSTTRVDEVLRLLEGVLGRMGLSHSEKNAAFVLAQLKGISGRLAMRMVNPAASRGELVGLALVHDALTRHGGAGGEEGPWIDLSAGLLVPLDDVLDLDPLARTPRRSGGDADEEEADGRADLLSVQLGSRKSLVFRFVEVKYRRHLRSAMDPGLAEQAAWQADGTAARWREHYFGDGLNPLERGVRISRLAVALSFYARRAGRHRLSEEVLAKLLTAIDRLVSADAQVTFPPLGNRVLLFSPECGTLEPKPIPLPPESRSLAFVFGPGHLPDGAAGGADDDETDRPEAVQESDAQRNFRPVEPSERVGDEPKAQPIEAPTTAPADTSALELEQASADEASDVRILLGHRDKGGEEIIWTVGTSGNPHLMIVGQPGMGKTVCLLNLCQQFAAASVTPIVFSFHQDVDEAITGPLPGTRFLRPDQLGFNPLQVQLGAGPPSPSAHVDSAGMMRDVFSAIFPDLGDVQLGTLREAIKKSFESRGWGGGRVPEDPAAAVPPFRDFFQRLISADKPDRGLVTRLKELDDYGVFSGAAAGTRLLDEPTPAVLQIHSSPNDVIQQAFASLLLYGVYQDMFRRGPQKKLTHVVIFDEAHRAANLKLLPTMAKECRKYGVALVLASQEARDFDESLYSGIANYLCFNVTENDAKAIARHCVGSDERVRTIDRLKAMPKHQALFFPQGGQRPRQVRLLPPSA